MQSMRVQKKPIKMLQTRKVQKMKVKGKPIVMMARKRVTKQNCICRFQTSSVMVAVEEGFRLVSTFSF